MQLNLRRKHTALLVALGSPLIALFALPGCDNPLCVYAPGNCSGDDNGGSNPGVLGTSPATLPVNGELLLEGLPKISAFVPKDGDIVDVHTPIVLLFSESMSPTNLSLDFQLDRADTAPLPLTNASLIANGRLLVLLPPAALAADTDYKLRFRPDVAVADRTGQVVTQSTDGLIATFHTRATPTTVPKLLMTFPPNDSTQASATGEIVVVFDRPMNASTFNHDSFIVEIGNDPPAFDPLPVPLSVNGGNDTRVFRYQSLDANGDPAFFGANKTINVDLSPDGHEIEDSAGHELADFHFDYKTTSVSAPTSAAITSAPTDAIGIHSIDGAEDLGIRIVFPDAASGDRVNLYMFGTDPKVTPSPPLIALFRDLKLEAPFTEITMTADELDLRLQTSPVKARFADGKVNFAFAVRRGSSVTPVRLLDVDASTKAVDSPTIDTVAPKLLGLSTSGSTTATFRSDMRDIVLVGRASERVRCAMVSTTTQSDNAVQLGVLPPVVGSTDSGLFVAAPVRPPNRSSVGVLAQDELPVAYTLTIYDRALNAAPAVNGQFTQVGASGPAIAGTPDISVDVFDATTLAPIAGARVSVHENIGGLVLFVEEAQTTSGGHADLASGLLESIVTVDKPGYDIFTFDGVPTNRISVPLHPTTLADATVDGDVTGPTTSLNLYQRTLADTRLPAIGETLADIDVCTAGLGQVTCPYDEVTIVPRRIGAQSAFAVLEPPNEGGFSALSFLRAFAVSVPVAPAAAGASTSNNLTFPEFLSDPGVDAEKLPIEVPVQDLSTVNFPLLEPGDAPRVRVEAIAPGIPGTLTVGLGLAFDAGPSTWRVRAAYAGVADGSANAQDALGKLVAEGTIGADLALRAEVVDVDGNRGAARPRFSNLSSSMLPPAPALVDPGSPFDTGTLALELDFSDVLPDAYGEQGLYRVTLTDSAHRRWTIYRVDALDAKGPSAIVHLPFLGGLTATGIPLAAGDLECQISAFAWSSFDPLEFMWSDIEREADLFSHAAAVLVTPP